MNQELEDQRYKVLAEQYREALDKARGETDFWKARLMESWQALRGQSKGLQRQRRIINRLRKQLAMAEDAAAKGDLARANAAGMQLQINDLEEQLRNYL
jgi:hypothetical protein